MPAKQCLLLPSNAAVTEPAAQVAHSFVVCPVDVRGAVYRLECSDRLAASEGATSRVPQAAGAAHISCAHGKESCSKEDQSVQACNMLKKQNCQHCREHGCPCIRHCPRIDHTWLCHVRWTLCGPPASWLGCLAQAHLSLCVGATSFPFIRSTRSMTHSATRMPSSTAWAMLIGKTPPSSRWVRRTLCSG